MTIHLAFLLFVSWAQAKETCERRYTLSFPNTAPSFYIDNKREKQGNSYLILKEIIKKIGCKDSEKPGSFLHIRQDFRRSQVDILGLTLPEENLDTYGEFIELYRIPRSLIVSNKFIKDNSGISDYLKDPQITFATVIGLNFFIEPEEKDFLLKHSRLIEVPAPPDVFSALLAGRAKAVFSSPVFTYHFLYKTGRMKEFTVIPDVDRKSRLGIYLSKKRLSLEERDRIKKVIYQIKSDGTIERLVKRSVSPEDFKYYELPKALPETGH